jgi:hypothetical protein
MDKNGPSKSQDTSHIIENNISKSTKTSVKVINPQVNKRMTYSIEEENTKHAK